MMQNYFAIAVLIATAYAINGGVSVTSRLTPFQVTFGDDGRLRLEDFKRKTPCGYEKPETTGGQEDGFSTDEATTDGGQYDPESTYAQTTFLDISQSPCATYQSSSIGDVRIPGDGSTISFPVRLDFNLKSTESNLIEVRFMGENIEIYVVRFRRGNGIDIQGEFVLLPDLELDESHRFWVTYENGEVKVGLHRTDSPLMQYTDPDFKTNEVDSIELYSKTKNPTEWKLYEPCTFQD